MRKLPAKLGSAIIFAIAASACAPQTEVIKLHDETSSVSGGFANYLVVAIAGDADTRREFEDQIANRIRAAGALATAAHIKTGAKTELLQDEIDTAASEIGADAILITHIVSVDTTVESQEGRVDIKAECREGDLEDYFLYDYEVLKEPDTVRVALTVVAVTNLYDSGSGERLWTIQSTCFEKATMHEVLSDEAEAIANQLRYDRLIG